MGVNARLPALGAGMYGTAHKEGDGSLHFKTENPAGVHAETPCSVILNGIGWIFEAARNCSNLHEIIRNNFE
jgi:hypothetical protein